MAAEPELILASGSPRRKELLALCGLNFEIVPASVNESADSGEDPAELVKRLALQKAAAVGEHFPHAWVIGADTVVVLNGKILGKPAGEAEAREMLSQLAGREHEVFTGLAVCRKSPFAQTVEFSVTQVIFTPMSARQIEEYVRTGEPMDKAGAYAIQGYGGQFVAEIHGSYSNVVGLDIAKLLAVLRREGAVI